MAATTTSNLKMVFALDNDRSHTLSIANPKANLTLSEVTEVSETLLAREAIIVGGSAIASLTNAYIETVTKTDLE